MDFKTAVFFLPDAMTLGSSRPPLVLQTVYFCPALTWTAEEMAANGVERFFVVCDSAAHDLVRPLFPAGKTTMVDGATHADILTKEFESSAERLLIVTGVVLPVGVFGGGAAFSADAEKVCAVLREHGSFAAVPEGAEPVDGYLPIGDAAELADVLPMCREKILRRHIENGVCIMDPNTTYIDPRAVIGAGTTLLPGTIIRGRSVIGCDCEIGPNAVVRDCTVGDRTTINASQVNESRIGSDTTVGPFAYVRPNSTIGDHVKAGDFVEIKNSVIGNGTKISHLTYIGDSDVGERVNFGCGTVTVNYNGFEKNRTTVEDDAFIGCNTNLVAPVRVGRGAYTAAGSTIDKDVPAHALGIARERQTNKEGWAKKFAERYASLKKK